MINKYIHLFGNEECIFITRLGNFFDAHKELFKDDHLIVTTYKKVYEHLKENGLHNILFYENEEVFDHNVINHFAEECEWLFVHSMPPISDAIFIKNKYLSHIVWRMWGHDVGYDMDTLRSFAPKNVIRRFIQMVWRAKVNKMKLIGIANIGDRIDMIDRFGDKLDMIRLPYSKNYYLDSNYNHKRIYRENVKIMVGHSGNVIDNHIEILEKINHLKNRDIQVYLVLSYGKEDYIKRIKSYVSEKWKEKATVIDNVMPLQEYIEFLRAIDVAVLDGKTSYALGNISYLLDFGTKFYLNREGTLHKAFDICSIPHGFTSDLDTVDFEELTRNTEYTHKSIQEFLPLSKEGEVEAWEMTLSKLI